MKRSTRILPDFAGQTDSVSGVIQTLGMRGGLLKACHMAGSVAWRCMRCMRLRMAANLCRAIYMHMHSTCKELGPKGFLTYHWLAY